MSRQGRGRIHIPTILAALAASVFAAAVLISPLIAYIVMGG